MRKVICLILCIAIVLVLCGCRSYNKSLVENDGNDKRMSIIYADGVCCIYRDNATGVQYFARGNGGTCAMVNADGSPYTGEG
jgi:hypothetical protein